MTAFILHNYFRSSTSIRVRAALNWKGLPFEYVPHHLRRGEHREASYLAINPQGLVPSLVLEDGTTLTQSLSIIEYLEREYPEPPLLPKTSIDRARVRAIAYAIACEVHPLNNLRVLEHLRSAFGADEGAITLWFRHWVNETFKPLEKMLADDSKTGRFCHGDAPSIADVCLYAQVINNQRFNVDMSGYPTISRIFEACSQLPQFQQAAPDNQPDAE